jgi:cardiolipin synthase
VLAPVLLILAWQDLGRIFLIALIACYATDVLDGYFARTLGQVTEFGSMLDSTADRLVYLAMPICAYWLRPELYREETIAIIVLLSCFVLPLLISFIKFGKLSSYHTLSSKVAAFVFAVCMITVFSNGPSFTLKISAIVFVFAALQDIAITYLLPQPVTNIRSIVHAKKIINERWPG